MSDKMQQQMANSLSYTQATPFPLFPAPSTDVSASNYPPSTPALSASDDRASGTQVSPQDVQGLRAEVANLREVIQLIHDDRAAPPPTYGIEA